MVSRERAGFLVQSGKCALIFFVCAQDDGKIEELLDIVRDVVKGWPFDD